MEDLEVKQQLASQAERYARQELDAAEAEWRRIRDSMPAPRASSPDSSEEDPPAMPTPAKTSGG